MQVESPVRDAAPPAPARRGWCVGVLLGILLLAAILRIAALPAVPPGLHQDEAVNAWNAWCLLKTGRDQAGAPWPIFYMHALGENRSALHLYALIPFQVLGGLNVWTTRLPAAVGGVLTVLLIYWIGARMVDRATGLVAAALLTLNPWHLQLSRLGLEASLAPLLVTVALAVLLWAGFPLGSAAARPRIVRALLAGLVVGICFYGYAAVRLFLPPFLAGCVLLTWRAWGPFVRTRRGAAAPGALLIGLGVTLGPLTYQHLAHPAEIALRAARAWVWEPGDPLAVKAVKVAERYLEHFGLDFLFRTGTPWDSCWSNGYGVYSWYVLPLLVAGLIFAVRGAGRSRAARVLLCWVLLFPVSDCLLIWGVITADGIPHVSLHPLRSAPGMTGPILLAALGAVAAWRGLQPRYRIAGRAALGVFVAGALLFDTHFLTYFFGQYNRRPEVYHGFHVDLVEACAWLRPHVDSADAIFITAADMNMPYIITLVCTGYDPATWFRAERDVRTFSELYWEYYFRVGKFYFIHDRSVLGKLDELMQNGRPDRVIFIVRPGEVGLDQPVHTIRGPDGRPELLIYDVVL